MNVLKRINELRKNRGWSIYKLSEESGITQSTLANMFNRQTQPSISTLTALCEAFGITLSQFFDCDLDNYSSDELLLLNKYKKLNVQEKTIINSLIDTILKQKSK